MRKMKPAILPCTQLHRTGTLKYEKRCHLSIYVLTCGIPGCPIFDLQWRKHHDTRFGESSARLHVHLVKVQDGDTALHACEEPAMAQVLLDAGAKLEAQNSEGL